MIRANCRGDIKLINRTVLVSYWSNPSLAAQREHPSSMAGQPEIQVTLAANAFFFLPLS